MRRAGVGDPLSLALPVAIGRRRHAGTARPRGRGPRACTGGTGARADDPDAARARDLASGSGGGRGERRLALAIRLGGSAAARWQPTATRVGARVGGPRCAAPAYGTAHASTRGPSTG